MATEPTFAIAGTQEGTIDVRLSYKIVELFSEGLYASPNKALEELVANSFDAGANSVLVHLSPRLHDQDATIVVIDDGESMDVDGLKRHWLIGTSNKRNLTSLPKGRQQIGKFGIGKLATYVLANRLTHICKSNGSYYSTSMDYSLIQARSSKEIEPKSPIKIPLRRLSPSEAKAATKLWTDTKAFKASGVKLFGKGSSASWTMAIMSSLKEKVHEIKPGLLRWVLRTALPLRPDFDIWLDGEKLIPSKQGKRLLKKWVLGKDMDKLGKPCPKGVTTSVNPDVDKTDAKRFGLNVPGLGRITGYVEAYKDLLTGKSDKIGRSHGFFVYVFDRLINVADGHFGISPDELRHGTFGRFRLVIHMDYLDEKLRSNRETISEGPILAATQDVLRAIFNAVRSTLERHDDAEEPGARLARKLASSPASLSRRPIAELAQAVINGQKQSRYLVVPQLDTEEDKNEFIESLEKRVTDADDFVTGLTIDFNGAQNGGLAQYNTVTGMLEINAWHPFVATFHDEFTNKVAGQPLELLAMAEVLAEAHLHTIGVKQEHINDFMMLRDQLLRNLANESGRKSAFSVANDLRNSRNNPKDLEDNLCEAFKKLGFEVTPMGKIKEPDGVATAYLSATEDGNPRRYSVSLEAKSKQTDGKKVAASTVGISAIARQRNEFKCNHAIVLAPAFPTTKGEDSALAIEIEDDRQKSSVNGDTKTITLITIDDLAKLVRLRPVKQIGLQKLRELFKECRLPEESAEWVDAIEATKVDKPDYGRIIETIESLQKIYNKASVTYGALRVELDHLEPPISYATDDILCELCKGMAQVAPGAIYATDKTVELDQSAENVIAVFDSAMKKLSDR